MLLLIIIITTEKGDKVAKNFSYIPILIIEYFLYLDIIDISSCFIYIYIRLKSVLTSFAVLYI